MIRPKEREAIAKLLDEPAESLNVMAANIIITIDKMRADRTDWYVLVNDPGVCLHLHGPYITKHKAEVAVKNGSVYAASPGATCTIMQLIKEQELDSEA